MPVGLFDNATIDRFPAAPAVTAPGRTNDFRELDRKLFLVATNLDTGASVVFGAPGHDHVPISRAIGASSALPGLFPPVVIDGEHYVDGALNKTLHASLALDEGVDLLLCINPLVPYDGTSAATRNTRRARLTVDKLNQGGLPLVLSQTFRAIIHSRMKVGMEKYRAQYPDASVILFEPDREDAADVLREHLQLPAAQAHLRARLHEDATQPAGACGRAGAAVRAPRDPASPRPAQRFASARLGRNSRSASAASGSDADRTVRDTARDLKHTLDELERYLDDAAATLPPPSVA